MIKINNLKFLYCKSREASATGFRTENNGFVVLKDSKVSCNVSPAFSRYRSRYYEIRMKLEYDGTISNGIFQMDYEFSAPSAASSVVLGRSSNGRIDWKDENGRTLRDLIEN